MQTIRVQDNRKSYFSNDWILCIIATGIALLYSFIIQYKYVEIPNGMLLFGILVLITFTIGCAQKKLNPERIFTRESIWMLVFMGYALVAGIATSPATDKHISQWITSLEYMFMMIVISSVIKDSGTDSFHNVMLIISLFLAVIFLQAPVLYAAGGRYSISKEVNPNGLGMTFTSGIWIILFFQQKKKLPILLPLAIVILLVYCIFQTGSRKALIGAGIIIALWYIFCYIPAIFRKKNNWKLFIILFSVLVIVILGKEFLRLYSGSDIEARMGGLDNEMTGGKRASLYKEGWMLFKEKPLFGLGFQGYSYYFGGYSHATLVEIPVSGGIIGSIIYFVAYYISIKKYIVLYQICKKSEDLLIYSSEIKMGLILWVAMLFYCSCIIHPYQFDSYILFGIIFGQSAYIEGKLQKQNPNNLHIEETIWKRKYKYIR